MTARSTHRTTLIDVTTLRDGLAQETTPRILDVRSPGEFETAHIPGSHNVPLDLLRAHSAQVSRHIDEHTVLVCQSGSRGEQARGVLEADGLGLRVLDGGKIPAPWGRRCPRCRGTDEEKRSMCIASSPNSVPPEEVAQVRAAQAGRRHTTRRRPRRGQLDGNSRHR